LLISFGSSAQGANVDLTLTFTDSPDPVTVGNNLTYTVTVANGNLNRADDVLVTIPLPTGTTYVSGCSLSGSNVVCDLGSINKNTSSPSLNFVVKAPSSATTLSASATVTTSDTNLNAATATKVTTTIVNYGTDNWRQFTSVNYPGPHNMKGDIAIIGNSIMVPLAGGCFPSTTRNNDAVVTYADIDSDSSTFNSTSAELKLPLTATDKEIVWAGLYWQGYLVDQNDANKTNAQSVLFKTPTSSNYVNLTSDPAKFNWLYVGGSSYDRFYYQGVADVTSLVKAAGEGNYSVANIYSNTLQQYNNSQRNTLGGAFGAWSIVIVYADASTTFKNISVYDGYVSIGTVGATATGPVFTEYDVTLSGFFTPKAGAVNSNFLVFAGEGDAGSGTGDYTKMTSGSDLTNFVNIYNTLNPADNIYNASVTNNGVAVTDRSPNCANTVGIDIDKFAVGSNALSGTQGQIIQNMQTQTKISLNSSGDGYFPGVFAFSTDLYVPELCYDYALSQHDRFFSHDNSPTAHLHGYLSDTSPLTTRIMLRNREVGSEATNVKLRIEDINSNGEVQFFTDQADLDLKKTLPGGMIYTAVPSSDITTLSTADLKFNFLTGTGVLGYDDSIFAEFDLQPLTSGEIDVPLDMYVDFNFTVGSNVYGMTNLRLDETIPRCVVDAGSVYAVNLDIFNTVDSTLNPAPIADGSTTIKYNLPTHVVKRPIDLKVVSFNPASLHTVRATSGMIALEVIDMGGYYDSKSACADPNSVISPRLWVPFGELDSNVTHMEVNASSFNNAFNLGITQTDFFGKARENAAYRMSYNLDDNNGSVKVDEFNPGRYKLTHFTTYAGQVCAVDIDGNLNSTDTVPQWCGNNGSGGGSGMTAAELRVCMECIFGLKTRTICSRDNFAIRPEAFDIKITDSNNSAVVPYTANVAAGYDYRFDINATTHTGSDAASGYSAVFKEGISLDDRNASFTWEPNGHDVSGCNDVTSPSVDFYFANGTIINQLRHLNNVGRYEMGLRDYAWTKVDQVNHTAGNNWNGGQDCVVGVSTVPLYTTDYAASKPGCIISSEHHNNKINSDYYDYALTFRPYKFEMASIGFGLGTLPNAIGSGGSGFVYTSDMSRDDSMNMSLRSSGNINAVGKNGVVTTNFVTSCYAEDLNLSMTSHNNLTLAGTNYQVRFMDFNSSGTLIYDSNATDVNTSALTMLLTTIDDGNYTKSTAGALSTITRLNYDRSFTQTTNPIMAQYGALGVKCTSPANCTMYADGASTFEAVGSRAMDFNVTHAYGRIIPRDVRVFGSVPFSANAWYEVFNASTLMGTALPASRNEALWYTNTQHNDTNYGDGNVTRLQSAPTVSTAVNVGGDDVNGMETYNFGAVADANIPYSRKAHIDTAPWLWYGTNAQDYLDPSNANLDCRTHPCFNINVVPSVGATGSAKTSNKETKGSKKTDSGGGTWKSTSDYAPAIR
jgi:uncharacterized repeat protein (TIGR01451 family)